MGETFDRGDAHLAGAQPAQRLDLAGDALYVLLDAARVRGQQLTRRINVLFRVEGVGKWCERGR